MKTKELEVLANRFVDLVDENRKRDALEYYNGLGEKEQQYIEQEYDAVLKCASFRF